MLAFTTHASRIERLVVLDPAAGRRRRLEARICDTGPDPWSPDGTRLALAVSLPHRACRGGADTPSLIGVTATWRSPLSGSSGAPAALLGGTAGLLRTGRRRAAFPFSLGAGAAWSSGRRFLALQAVDDASRASLLVVDGSFRSRVGAFSFGQQAYASAPRRPWLAFASGTSVRIFDASTRRVIATIPVRAPYGLSVDLLGWAPDRRSVTLVAAPGLGHD